MARRQGSGSHDRDWPRGRARGLEPLGPFEEEDGVGQELEDGRSGRFARAEAGETQGVEDPGKNIIVTTGISTWSERRRSPLAKPVEEEGVVVGAGGGEGLMLGR